MGEHTAVVLGRPMEWILPTWSQPSVTRWLRENDREALIRAAFHVMHVKGGEVLEDNGYTPQRGRVTHVIYLDQL